MIPKIIHYCWFGRGDLPELALKCIESWKKYCPDYEIIQWNEDNFIINEKCDYVKEAYIEKKWAFISDYARFEILYDYGGIYFDTDVELINPIDDLLKVGAFMGMEDEACIKNGNIEKFYVASGLGLAAEPKDDIYKDIIEGYKKRHFSRKCGEDEQLTVVTFVSNILTKYNPILLDSGIIKISNIFLYPPEYFCPLNYHTGVLTITNNTKSIHHYMASWYTEKERKWLTIEQKIKIKYGEERGKRICESIFVRIIRLFYRRGLRGTIKRILGKNI